MTTETISPPDLSTLVLLHGGHSDRESGVCAMEAAAWLAGEPHTDRPECVCPVISTFMRSWNDGLPSNEERTALLVPLLPSVLNTRSTPAVELARAMLVIDWSLREFLPTWLEMSPALVEVASRLKASPPIQKWEDFDAIVPLINDSRAQAAAARAAARDAARAAAWDAALDAALAAAWDAVTQKLDPTKKALQKSASDLVLRMCAVREAA